MNVSVFPNVNTITKLPKKVHIDEVLERIRTGDKGVKEIIEKVRAQPTPESRREIKKGLISIIFSGYCGIAVEKINRSTGKKYKSYRDDKSLAEHSGFCVVDLDHMELDDLLKWISYFKALPYIYSVFISPSGDGLKVIYRIPADVSMHRSHYRAILADLEAEGLEVDATSINESRVCFISYDPDIYINKDAEEFRDFIEEEEIIDEVRDSAISKGSGKTDFRKLAIAAEMIDKAQDGHKHTTLIKAAYLMGGYVASGTVLEEDARRMLRDRIATKNLQNKQLAYNTIDDGLSKGQLKPIYEIEQIENEFNIELSKAKFRDDKRGFTFLVDKIAMDRKMMDYIKFGEVEGAAIGMKHLDEHVRLKENNFSVVLGHDNVGKSTVVWWLAVAAACLHGWKWIIYSPENKTYKIKKKLIDFVIGSRAEEAPVGTLKAAKAFVDEHFYFIRKDEVYTAFDVIEYGRVLCAQDPDIKGFMVDPYNSLSMDYKGKGAGLNTYEYHLRVISEFRIFSETCCSVYVNAHSVTASRRGAYVDEDGNIKRPQKSDIDQGAIWANRCDDFLVIHRQVKNKEEWMWSEIHVDKIKDVETGGSVTMGEPVKIKLMMYSDFQDEHGKSPLRAWRNIFFKKGEQQRMPLGNPDDAFG